MPIRSAGIGSGIDIESIVSQLVTAEGGPKAQRLSTREMAIKVEISAFAGLSSAMSDLQNSFELLKEGSFDNRNVTSSDKKVLTATVTNQAVPATYDITTTQLAKAHKVASTSFAARTDVVGTGTLSIQLGGYDVSETTFTPKSGSAAVNITIGSSNQTLEGVRDAINAANAGIQASIVNDGTGERLLLSSESTGVVNGMAITVTDGDGNNTDASGLSQLVFSATTKNMTTTVAAKDAAFSIDGLAITKPSNAVSDAIDGVTLTLEAIGTSKLTVAQQSAGVRDAIGSFVASYNRLDTMLDDLTAYNPDTDQAGALQGDYTARGIRSSLVRIFQSEFTTAGGKLRLSDLGVAMQENGSLAVDVEKRDAILKTRYDDVVSMFSTSKTGLAVQIDSLVSGFVGVGGILKGRTEGLDGRLKEIGLKRERLDARMLSFEQRLRKQYTAMDMLLSSMQSSADFLTQQFSTFSNANKKK